MKKLVLIFTSGILMMLMVSSYGSTSDGKVIEYWIHYGDDNSFVFMVENQQSRPACASFGSPNGRYAVNMTTEKGKMIAAAIMAAEASKATVYVHGKGLCEQWFDAEDVWHISVR